MARKKDQLPTVTEAAGLPAFPLLDSSEVVRFVPPKELVRAKLTLRQDIALYLQSCSLSYSKNTLKNYGSNLAEFERVISEKYGQPIPSAAVNPEAVQFYLLDLRTKRAASSTFDRNYYSLKAFFQFREMVRGLPNVMDRIQRPKTRARPEPLVLPIEDACRLCDLGAGDDSPEGLRDGAMVEVLYSTGVRVQELCNLDWADLDEEAGFISVRKGKGGKDRRAPIGEIAIRKLAAWRDCSKPELSQPIFTGIRRGRHVTRQRLTTRAVQALFPKRCARAAVNTNATPHTMRHCFATHMLARGGDIQSIADMVGHSSLTITAKYIHLNATFLHEQAGRHPLWSRTAA